MISDLDLTENDLEDEAKSEIVIDGLRDRGEERAQSVEGDFRGIEQHREKIAGLEERLYEHWGSGIDRLEQVLLTLQSLGAEINHENRFEAVQENDVVFEALTQLNARACRVAFEILTLIKSGYADGAYARWRSLHEIAVTAMFLRDRGEEAAEKFLLYEAVETYYFAESLDNQQEEDGLSDELLAEFHDYKQQLVDQFGEQYDWPGGRGWAADEIEGRATFENLEEEADMAFFRPYYYLANHTIHATPKGTLDSLGEIEIPDTDVERDVLLSGPSNAGLERPAFLAANSLLLTTLPLLLRHPSVEHIIDAFACQALIVQMQDEFRDCAEELMEKERDVLKQQSNMDITDIARQYVGFDTLLSNGFVSESTAFDTAELFVSIVPGIDSAADLNGEVTDETKTFIADASEYESFSDFTEGAFEYYVLHDKNMPDIVKGNS